MSAPEEYIPAWLQHVLAVLFGAGGVKMVSVLVENRRLGKKEFRETLMERIEHLESELQGLNTLLLRRTEDVARLEAENGYLLRRLKFEEE